MFYGCLSTQSLLSYLALQSLEFERTRWTLSWKGVVCTDLDIYQFIGTLMLFTKITDQCETRSLICHVKLEL